MQLIDRVASWDNSLLDRVGNSFSARIDVWLVNHPFLFWLVNHPIISLVIGLISTVLIIRLLVTIYHGVASTIDRMWLWILRSPFLLLKLLFGWEVKPQENSANATITNYEITNNPEKLAEILNRLEYIQQQQQQIVRDIALLKQSTLNVKSNSVGLEVTPKELPSIVDR